MTAEVAPGDTTKQTHSLKINPEAGNRQILFDSDVVYCSVIPFCVCLRVSVCVCVCVSVLLEGKWQNKPELPTSWADWWADWFGCIIY